MELLGYIGAVLMGISLGLIGGGGSILTIPILVYLFGLDMVTATSYSLFVVGTVSAVGGVRSWRKGAPDVPALLWFGLPSVAAVLVTRTWLLPSLPDPLFHAGEHPVSRGLGLLLLFAVLMLGAALRMMQRDRPGRSGSEGADRRAVLLPLGLALGVVTGLLGAGGGFLIIPALVLYARTPMKQAIGTSLLIIAVNTLIGFAGDLLHGVSPDRTFLAVFTALAIAGVVLGGRWNERIANEKLKPAFGWFVLVMGIYIIGRELSALA